MLTILIGLIFLFAIYMAVGNAAWLTLALAVVVLLFLIMCSSEERKSSKAYVNWRDYWANRK